MNKYQLAYGEGWIKFADEEVRGVRTRNYPTTTGFDAPTLPYEIHVYLLNGQTFQVALSHLNDLKHLIEG